MTYDDWRTTEPLEPHPEDELCEECGEYVTECACGDELEPPEPDYGYAPYEETAKYREEMIDAGRGHLLR